VTGSRKKNIDPLFLCHETDIPFFVRSDEGHDNEVTFFALKIVDA
jgi:hypothetical protein